MNVCRTCTLNIRENDKLVSSFSPLDDHISIADMIATCTAVMITEDEQLSTMLCGECAEAVKEIYQFVKKVQDSDRKLRTARTADPKLDDYEGENGNDSQSASEFYILADSDDGYLETDEQCNTSKVIEGMYVSEYGAQTSSPRRSPTSSDASGGKQINELEEPSQPEMHMLRLLAIQEQHVCCGCLRTFSTDSEKISHSQKTHATRRRSTESSHKNYTCDTCHKRYSTLKALQQHTEKLSHAKSIFECIQCHKRFIEGTKAEQHVRERHPMGSPDNSGGHETDSTSVPKICCAQACGMSFESEEQLLHHSHSVHYINKIEFSLAEYGKRPIECFVCFKRFETEVSLQRHQQRSYKPLFYQCALCGLKFRGGEALAIHERSHRNEKPFSCETCHKTFASKTVLKTHRLTHSDERPFVCETCGAAFRRKSNLQVHVLSHTDEHPFPCGLCPAKFKAKAHLNYHKRTHTGEKPYQCRHCEKTFADHTNRARHEMSHTGIKPYECAHCHKTFTQKRILARHEATHSNDKRFKCGTCDQSFQKKTALNVHLKTHFLTAMD